MPRALLLALFCLPFLMACNSHTIQTFMRGNMDMNGDMRMEGDMRMAGDVNMAGDMKMNGEVSTVMRPDNTASRVRGVPVYSGPTGAPESRKIVVLDVDGLLVNKNLGGFGSMGENPVALIREKLDVIATDESIAAIVLRINSPGGGVTAADIMTRDLGQLKAQRDIPVVACLMDVGTGGAYYLATAADRVVAHPTSIVGGFGVILNVYNLELTLAQFNVAPVHIKAGERIDIATPERPMEEEERKILQSMATTFHDRFVDRVVASRPRGEEIARDVFDGRIFTGEKANEYGLVDSVGYLDDAIVVARELAELPADAPLVMLRRDNDRAYTLFDVTPNSPTMTSLFPLKIPGLDRGDMPTFMYLWQPEPGMAN